MMKNKKKFGYRKKSTISDLDAKNAIASKIVNSLPYKIKTEKVKHTRPEFFIDIADDQIINDYYTPADRIDLDGKYEVCLHKFYSDLYNFTLKNYQIEFYIIDVTKDEQVYSHIENELKELDETDTDKQITDTIFHVTNYFEQNKMKYSMNVKKLKILINSPRYQWLLKKPKYLLFINKISDLLKLLERSEKRLETQYKTVQIISETNNIRDFSKKLKNTFQDYFDVAYHEYKYHTEIILTKNKDNYLVFAYSSIYDNPIIEFNNSLKTSFIIKINCLNENQIFTISTDIIQNPISYSDILAYVHVPNNIQNQRIELNDNSTYHPVRQSSINRIKLISRLFQYLSKIKINFVLTLHFKPM